MRSLSRSGWASVFGIALSVAVISSDGASGGGSDTTPRIDRKPKLLTVALDERSGRDAVLVTGKFDNPLDLRDEPESLVRAGDSRHRARLRLGVRAGGTAASVRSKWSKLQFHAGRKTTYGTFVVRLPRDIERAATKRGDGASPPSYTAKLVHVLNSPTNDAVKDRAVATGGGSLGPGPVLPGSQIQLNYTSDDGPLAAIASFELDGVRPKIGRIVFNDRGCGGWLGTYRNGSFTGFSDQQSGYVNLNKMNFTAKGTGGWGMLTGGGYELDTTGGISFSGSFSAGGTVLKLKVDRYFWDPIFGGPPFVCEFPKRTIVLNSWDYEG